MDSDTQPVFSPSETQHPTGKPNRFLLAGLIGLLLTAAFIFSAPILVRSRKNADHVQAINNARQIGLALFEFEQSYGSFPNDITGPEVIANTSSKLHFGSKYSNDYFRQLIASKIAQSEALFYANIPNRRIPDNDITTTRALEKGECGFSYLMGAEQSHSPETPIVITPLIPGSTVFDYKGTKNTFFGRTAILRLDGAVQSPPIDKAGRVWLNGKDLFDPTQPFWNGKAPVVKWPDL